METMPIEMEQAIEAPAPGNGETKQAKSKKPRKKRGPNKKKAADINAMLAREQAAEGIASIMHSLNVMAGLDVPLEGSKAVSLSLWDAVCVTWPEVNPVALAWGQVALVATAVYGPAIAAKYSQAPAPKAEELA